MQRKDLEAWIKRDEGFSKRPYKCTGGKTTIAWGRNLDDNDLELEIAELMFQNDLNKAINSLKPYKFFNEAPKNVQAALINMCFNLGIRGLLKFKKMIIALEEKNYTKAAIEALDSLWSKQVGNRAKDIALQIKNGSFTQIQ